MKGGKQTTLIHPS